MSSIIIVRLIPKADYGVYAYANSLLGMFCIFEAMGMTTALLQYGCTSEGNHKQQIRSFTFYVAVAFQFLLCLVIFLSGMLFEFNIKGTGILLSAMSFLPLFRVVRDMQNIYMRTEFKTKEFASANNFYTIVTVLFSVLLSLFLYVYGLILATYISVILSCLFIAYYQRYRFPTFDWSLPKGEKKELVKFALVSAITNSSSSIVYVVDSFLLGIVVAKSDVVASYKVAMTIPTALNFIPMAVMTYVYPYFAKHSSDSQWCLKHLKKVYCFFGVANLLLSLFLIVLTPLITNIIFGSQYLDSVPIMRVLFLNYFISATFYVISGQLLVTLKKITFNLVVNFAVCIVNLFLNTILISHYDGIGAALATTISTFFSAVACSAYLLYCYKKQC